MFNFSCYIYAFVVIRIKVQLKGLNFSTRGVMIRCVDVYGDDVYHQRNRKSGDAYNLQKINK